MMKTGMKQADVARQLSVSVTSIEIWLSRYPTSESLRSQAKSRKEAGAEPGGENRLGGSCLEKAPVCEETGEETDCQRSSDIQDSRRPLPDKCLSLKSLKLRRLPKT